MRAMTVCRGIVFMAGSAISYDSVSLAIAIASLIASIAAALIAKSSLSQAEQVAERDKRDWQQRKWFELYFKATEAYDFLDYFQKTYGSPADPRWGTNEWQQGWNKLMFRIREAHSMAVVFPKDAAIDALFDATAVFKNQAEAASPERLQAILDATEGLRSKSLVDASILTTAPGTADKQPNSKLFGKYQELVLLLLGFVLTTIIGGAIGARFQERSWTHEHLVQVCETARDTRTAGVAKLSDLMDKRLLKMRQLAWKLESAHSMEEVGQERQGNREARDEWAMQLNSNLAFVQSNFGEQAKETLQQQITGGFGNIHSDFNALFERGKIDQSAVSRIEAEIDALNPTIYWFDIDLQQKITDQSSKCSTMP
jgi:hypothetical protein